jgi:hypothetical protein
MIEGAPFGPLVLVDDAGDLGAGALVRALNLRPVRTADRRPAREVVGSPGRLFPALTGVVWAAVQERRRAQLTTSTGTAAALRRLVTIERTAVGPEAYRLAVYDFSQASTSTGLVDPAEAAAEGFGELVTRDLAAAPTAGLTATLPAAPAGARLDAALVNLGSLALVVVSAQAPGTEAPRPLETYLLTDGELEAWGRIPTPRASFTEAVYLGENREGYEPGVYVYRTALAFPGGTFGPLGPPRSFAVAANGANPSYDARYSLEFDVSNDASAEWQARAEGVAVFVGYAPHSASQKKLSGTAHTSVDPPAVLAAGGPYYLVVKKTWAESSDQLAVTPHGALETRPTHPEGNLLYCAVRAACAVGYNGRAVLGGVELDFPAPDRLSDYTTGSSTVRVAVEIETATGTYRRYSLTETSTTGAYTLPATDPRGYPDRRAKRLLVFRQTATVGTWAQVAAVPLVAPPTSNCALTAQPIAVPALAGGEPTVTEADIAAAHAARDEDPNRVMAGEERNPYDLQAARSQRAGDGPDDAVVALKTNAAPASEGQYGEHPLIALCRSSAKLLAVNPSGATFFGGAAPLAGGRGAPSASAAVNVGRAVVVADGAGVRTYTPQPEADASSEPVHGAAFLADLAAGLVLGWRSTPNGDEVWAASPGRSGVWAYAVERRAWYQLALDRRAWFTDGEALYGVDVEGRLWQEEAGDGVLPVELETGPLALGAPEHTKRLRAVRLAQRPPLFSAQLAVLERVLVGDVPLDLPTTPDGQATDEPILPGQVLAGLDGQVLPIHGGNCTRPRLLVSGFGRRGERLVEALFDLDVRKPDRLLDGQRHRL